MLTECQFDTLFMLVDGQHLVSMSVDTRLTPLLLLCDQHLAASWLTVTGVLVDCQWYMLKWQP